MRHCAVRLVFVTGKLDDAEVTALLQNMSGKTALRVISPDRQIIEPPSKLLVEPDTSGLGLGLGLGSGLGLG